MKLLIDCGGSGIKIKRYAHGVLRPHTYPFKPKSFEEFCANIEEMAKDGNLAANPCLTGIAISLCGEYDYVNEEVASCWFYKFLIGKLKDRLAERFKCGNVRIFNDGDAHVLALKEICSSQRNSNLRCAINLSLGTSVGFGMLDWKGQLMHTCQGHNWEACPWKIETSEDNKSIYWALGSEGLASLENRYGSPNAYIYYGQRLCHFFVRDLIPLFHPKIIGLSGGITAGHAKEIEEGINRECDLRGHRNPGGRLDGVEFCFSTEKDFVMRGLASILKA